MNLIVIQEYYLLNKEFSKCFYNSNLVLLCPLYAAGEKRNSKYKTIKFAKLISKLSKTEVIIIRDFKELKIYFKKNLNSDEIIIGMGAGLISKHMRNLKRSFMTLNLEFAKKFRKNISNNIKLSNYSWFNLGGPADYFFKPENKNN